MYALSKFSQIEDKVPWWGRMLTWGGIALAVIGVCFLLWYTGLGYLIKKIVYAFGMFIPSHKQTIAKMAIDATDDPNKADKLVTVVREDPAVDAAYRREKKKKGKNG